MASRDDIEDGMGFAGLVPSRAEREAERREAATRSRYMDICEQLLSAGRLKDERIACLEGLLRELTDIEGPQPGHVMWYRKVQEALGIHTSKLEVGK